MNNYFKTVLFAAVLLFIFASCGDRPKPASAYEVWGIDVSRHQHHIDWPKLLGRERPDFVFLKATEGTLIKDPYYKRHRRHLEDNEILWGAYHFFGHRTSGKEQAQNFIQTANLKKGCLLPVLDVEPHRFFKDPEKLVVEVKAFCNEIKREYGIYPIIYSSSNFYARYLKADFPESKYYIWIADYSNIPGTKWQFWQHTDSYKITGAKAGVDRNVFVGDYDKLKQFVLK